jgi:hypothetical protein
MARYTRVQTVCLSLLIAPFLSGCATSFAPLANTTPGQSSLGTITGTAYGGRQPIAGANIYLLEASTAGYGGAAYGPGSSNISTSLLDSATGHGPDSIGYYAVTDANGRFSITGDYSTCTTGDQVYLYSLGGKPDGVNANSAAGLLAILGTCGSYNSGTTVNMNEVSTIAAAYAMAGFASDATHVGSGTTAAGKTGITYAFANAAPLFDTTTNPDNSPNTAPRTTVPGNANGSVPQQQIETLADILATCVNSAGPSYTQCSTLFTNGKSRLGASATDTATEAIFMAQNPGNTSVYNLVGAQPYGNYYSSAPKDLTIAISYTGNGITRVYNQQNLPGTLSVDGSGNIWDVSWDDSSLSAFTHLGVPLANSPFTGNGLSHPSGVAIDVNGHVWVSDFAASISIFNADGTANAITGTGSGCIDDAGPLAFDPSDNAWISSEGGYWLCKVNNAVTTYSQIDYNGMYNPTTVASDGSGNIWATNSEYGATAQVNKFNSGGTNINGSPFKATQISETYGLAIDKSGNAWVASLNNMLEITSGGTVGSAITSGGIKLPDGVAIDGDGNVWETDYGSINSSTSYSNDDGSLVELNSSGSPISGSAGYQSGTKFSGESVAIDSAGDVWTDMTDQNFILELIGAAAPVVNPLSVAVKNNQIGVRP